MKFNRIISVIVAMVMALSVIVTGCGNSAQSSDPNAYESLGTLDGEEIDYGLIYFAAKYEQANYEDYYLESMGDSMWSEMVNGNQTFEENVKASILKDFKDMLVLEKFASDYNIQLTTKEISSIKDAAEQFMEDNSDKAIKLMGASEEVITRYLELYTISSKVYQQILAEVDTNYELAEYEQATFSYVMLDKDEYTKADAGALLKECLEDYAGTVGEGTDYETVECSYGATGTSDTNIEQSILDAAETLTNGQVYESVLETDSAYFIIHMDDTFDEEATNNKYQSMVNTAQSEHYEEVLAGYMEQVTFEIDEEAWNAITFTDHFSIISLGE